MNAATIAIATGATALLMAAVWLWLAGKPDLYRRFVMICAAALGAALIASLLIQVVAQLERTFAFMAPLAAIQFGVTAVAALLLARQPRLATFAILPSLIVLVVLGIVFADDGDQPSGRLSLPPRTSTLIEPLQHEPDVGETA